MSNHDDYLAKLPTIQAIPADQLKKMSMPLDVYVQEAENLYHWCQDDKAELTKVGLDWTLVDDLTVRAGACREAESLWAKDRFTKDEAEKLWKDRQPAGYELRDEILDAMRFAYRKDDNLLKRVAEIAEGSGHADMIQDLNDAAILGKKNSEPLTAISFDLTLLDAAATMASELGELYGQATTDRADSSPTKLIRDQAFAHLKEAVDEIYDCGQYALRKTTDRLKGYASVFLRRKRQARKNKAERPD